jgi:polynucleotide 5'-hydroxyl-kinase GRC3/NOL9
LAEVPERADGDPPPGPDLVRAQTARAPVILLVGDSDTGKTSLATALANALLAEGHRVGIVDGDVGQSEIGPPTTVGLGCARGPLRRLGHAELMAMRFVGSTSPLQAFAVTVEAMGALVERGLGAGLARIVVDGCGLVRGGLGHAFACATIDRVRPHAVVVLERANECESIVGHARSVPGVAVVRLPVAPGVRRRTAAERREWRARALAAHFASARAVRLSLGHVALRAVPGPRGAPAPGGVAPGTLVGLEDGAGETLGLGIARDHDPGGVTLTVSTGVPAAAVAAVAVGREVYSR